MPEVIMTIKAPRGTMHLYKLSESRSGRYLISRLHKQQTEAIKAFIEQHRE